MCAAQDSPQPRPLRGEKHPFPSRSSCASMRCLCRPNWVCFFFSAFPQFLASTSLEWRQNQFSLSWGLTAAPGFAHNRLTRLQQGRQPVSLVLLPYLAPKTAHRPSRGRIHFFSPERVYLPPLGGGARFCSSLGFRVLLGSCLWQPLATTGSHGSNRAGLLLPWCRFPTWPSKPHTGAYRGEFGFHRLFLVRFFCGSPASWRSR